MEDDVRAEPEICPDRVVLHRKDYVTSSGVMGSRIATVCGFVGSSPWCWVGDTILPSIIGTQNLNNFFESGLETLRSTP